MLYMDLQTILRRFLGRPLTLGPRARRPETNDERAAKKYWDEQVADDHERRGVNDKHP
jgi:hypothetical protein